MTYGIIPLVSQPAIQAPTATGDILGSDKWATIFNRQASISGLRPGGLQRDQARWRFHLAGDRGAGFDFLKALEHIYAAPLFF
jgi:hypothetical protein